MHPASPATRGSRPDLGPEERSTGKHVFKKSSAFTRWGVLIGIVGLGTAAVVAIAAAALFTLVDSSL
jgi:hypothetical protein